MPKKRDGFPAQVTHPDDIASEFKELTGHDLPSDGDTKQVDPKDSKKHRKRAKSRGTFLTG